jgi:hypothetical protein
LCLPAFLAIIKGVPHCPVLVVSESFYGMVRSTTEDLTKSFTVVPILALDTYTFALLSHHGGDDSPAISASYLLTFTPM